MCIYAKHLPVMLDLPRLGALGSACGILRLYAHVIKLKRQPRLLISLFMF